MSSTATLLVELLTEELPPRSLRRLSDAFARLVVDGLQADQFLGEDSVAQSYATPRRLAVSITNVRDKAPDTTETRKIMPVSVALGADGKPSVALQRKLAGMGLGHLTPEDFYRKPDGKTETFYYDENASGGYLRVRMETILEDLGEALPIPKVMTYQYPNPLQDQKFVRPAHGLVVIHGKDALTNVRALGLEAGRQTEGHRLQGTRRLTIDNADEYAAKLEREGRVIAGFDDRRRRIETALQSAAAALNANLAPAAAYEALLDEVTALTENPAVYTGRFDAEFLGVPQECLILTMRTNQKYFPLFDAGGKLRREFLVVSNMQLADPSRVIAGNERVIRPRLADAKFFYDQDRKTKLVDRVGRLANVVYHHKLGSQAQRIERMQILAAQIAKLIGADPALSTHAAALAKADLVTDMVAEFPELQGIMGRYYALHDGEPAEVADAIEQHYRPKFAGDQLPENGIAIAVALADKLDTLVGIYGIGLVPTGDKDAYGLRRHAVGVLRILIERKLPLELTTVLRMAESHFFHDLLSKTTVDDVHGFMLERLRGMLRDEGYTANEVEAVLSQRPTRIDLVPQRLAAVREFSVLPEAEALAAANKRIQNILKKADAIGDRVNEQLFAESAERDLWNALAAAEPTVEAALAAGRYTAALKSLAGLRGAVDNFFDKVLVNADDLQLRGNRLALLERLGRLMNRVADISKLAG